MGCIIRLGSPRAAEQCFLDTSHGKIKITQSLDEALRALREKCETLVFWADAVCINQSNTSEKVLQIQQMNQIFEKAERVAAWLGPEGRRSREVFETLEGIRQQMRAKNDEANQPVSLQAVTATLSCLPGQSDRVWEDLDSLLQRQWFERAWIAQELILPSKVVLLCGRHTEMDWDVFFDALVTCEREYGAAYVKHRRGSRLLARGGPAYALGITRQKMRAGERFSLLELLELFSHTRATKEVDKLFALLSLAYEKGDEPQLRSRRLTADYDSPLENVVRKYARDFVRRGQVMDLLYRAGEGKSYFNSWIPRLTRGYFPGTISTWDAAPGPFCAGKQTHPDYKVNHDSYHCLRVVGYVVDRVVRVDPVSLANAWRLTFLAAGARFRERLEHHAAGYPTGETLENLLLRLPIGDARRPHLETVADNLRAYRDEAAALRHGGEVRKERVWPQNLGSLVFQSAVHEQNADRFGGMSDEDRETVAKYWQTAAAFSNRLAGALFCATERRYVGLTAVGTVEGDQICLLHGAKVPFVMRKLDSAWRLVGECYIHGMMHGEVFKEPAPWKETTFNIE